MGEGAHSDLNIQGGLVLMSGPMFHLSKNCPPTIFVVYIINYCNNFFKML